jgi:hypothetical protein
VVGEAGDWTRAKRKRALEILILILPLIAHGGRESVIVGELDGLVLHSLGYVQFLPSRTSAHRQHAKGRCAAVLVSDHRLKWVL